MPKRVTYNIDRIILWLDLGKSWREINKLLKKPNGCVEAWLKRNNIEILQTPSKHHWAKLDRHKL